MITVTTDGPVTLLRSPYEASLPAKAKAIGGRWDREEKAWTFDARDEQRVRELARAIYGTDGADVDGPVVTIRVRLDDVPRRPHYTFDHGEPGRLTIAGHQLARRTGRDTAVQLSQGVITVEGGFDYRGGSVARPEVAPLDGTVLEVRDLPRSVADRMAAECPDAVTIVGDVDGHREALLAERDSLLARLAEIATALGE